MTLCETIKGRHVWTPEQKNSMRRLIEYTLRVWPNLIHCIRETQGQLVDNATERDYDFMLVARFQLELVALVDEGKYDEAVDRLAERLKQSVDEFFPDCTYPNYLKFLTENSERRSQQRQPESVDLQPQ